MLALILLFWDGVWASRPRTVTLEFNMLTTLLSTFRCTRF